MKTLDALKTALLDVGMTSGQLQRLIPFVVACEVEARTALPFAVVNVETGRTMARFDSEVKARIWAEDRPGEARVVDLRTDREKTTP